MPQYSISLISSGVTEFSKMAASLEIELIIITLLLDAKKHKICYSTDGHCVFFFSSLFRITDQRYEKLPYFLFGDFNFRLDSKQVIEVRTSYRCSLKEYFNIFSSFFLLISIHYVWRLCVIAMSRNFNTLLYTVKEQKTAHSKHVCSRHLWPVVEFC